MYKTKVQDFPILLQTVADLIWDRGKSLGWKRINLVNLYKSNGA